LQLQRYINNIALYLTIAFLYHNCVILMTLYHAMCISNWNFQRFKIVIISHNFGFVS